MIYIIDSRDKIGKGNYNVELEGLKSRLPLFPKLTNVDISETNYSNKKRMTISNGGLLKLRYDLYDYGDAVDIIRRHSVITTLIKVILFVIFVFLGIFQFRTADTFFQTSYKYLLLFTFIFALLIYGISYDKKYERLAAIFYTRDLNVKTYLVIEEKKRAEYKQKLLDVRKIKETHIKKDSSLEGVSESSLAKRKLVYRIGMILSVFISSYVLECIIIIFDKQKSLSSNMFLGLGFSSLPLYLYSLTFKNEVKYFDAKFAPKDNRFNMVSAFPLLILTVTFCFIMALSGDVYRGAMTIATIYLIVVAALLLIIFIRFQNIDHKNKNYCYIIYVALLAFNMVGASFYATSSAAEHVPCEYVSRSYSTRRNSTTYFVTVELQDGSIYTSIVGESTYDRAETAELVSCHRYGYLGVEYINVHCAD